MTDHLLRATVSVRSVLSDHRENVLVLQRVSDDEWELPGGRLSPYEGVIEGLCREVREETSLSVDIEDILFANSWINDRNNDRFAVYYDCQSDQRGVSLSAEHKRFRWVSPADAVSILAAPQAKAVRRSCTEEDDKSILEV